MEYQSVIRFGKNTLKVTFSGGSMNAIGVTPATYTTSNFLIQQAIENSMDYKRGRIRIERTIDLDEEVKIERPQVTPTAETSAPASAQTERREASQEPGTKTNEGKAREAEASDFGQGAAEEGDAQADLAEAQDEDKSEAAEAENAIPVTQVEFSCNDDAKDYLEQNFGYVRSKLRNREDIVNAGKAHNVEIIFV